MNPGPVPGIVFSGGGARGAYEAGVLKRITDHFLAAELPFPFRVVTGTSVGAIHAAYTAVLAGVDADQRRRRVEMLAHHWQRMEFGLVTEIDWGWLVRVLLRRDDPTVASRALLRTEYLEKLILEAIPWRVVRRAVRCGCLEGLAIPATQIATGRAVVFYDAPEERPALKWPNDPHVVGMRVQIGPRHVLASTAIPVLFRPVAIRRRLYCDGSLRLNTPLSPALRLGADALVVVRARPPVEQVERFDPERERLYGRPLYLLGKVIDTLMLDPIDRDLANLEMINALLMLVEELAADDEEALAAWGRAFRGIPFRKVRTIVVSPRVVMEELAAEALARVRRAPRGLRWLTRRLERGSPELGPELFSFLLFDRAYTGPLFEEGYADGAAAATALEELVRAGAAG